jgi:hypothetical protein
LAERLSLKKSQLYETLDVLKIYGAPVKYSRKLKTFYYENDWSMEINLKVKILTQNEEQKIFGGRKKDQLFDSLRFFRTEGNYLDSCNPILVMVCR